ncbi:MAG: glycosyltransferase [Alphaproteobacteria bacterium]
MPTPAVSVIMCVYNGAATLGRAIESVQAQTMRDWELVIIDDCSTDATRTLAEAAAQTDKRIKVISLPKNSGQSVARNAGIAHARGAWLAVVDADDWIYPTRLQAMLSTAEATNSEIIFDNQHIYDAPLGVISRVAIPNSQFRQGRAVAPSPHVSRPVTLQDFMLNSQMHQRFVWGLLKPLIKASVLNKAGMGYNTSFRMSEDFLLIIELMMHGAQCTLIQDPLYLYTASRGDLSATSSGFSTSKYQVADTLVVVAHILKTYGAQMSPAERNALHNYTCAALRGDAALRFKAAIKQRQWSVAGHQLLAHPSLPLLLGRSMFRAILYRVIYRRFFLWAFTKHA